MAAYATRDDVLARVGRLGGAFSVAGKRPNLADIDAWLDELSNDVGAAITGAGFDPSSLDADAQGALLDLVAYGAAARALRGLGDRSPEVLSILTEADAVWMAAMGDPTSKQADAIAGSIAIGTHPAIRDLAASGGAEALQASSFWDDEPTYGRPETMLSERQQLWGTNLAPGFSRGQHL